MVVSQKYSCLFLEVLFYVAMTKSLAELGFHFDDHGTYITKPHVQCLQAVDSMAALVT